MAGGIDITLGVLTRTKNEAALPVLVAALDGGDPQFAPAAFDALLARRGAALEELLARWPLFGDARKDKIVEHIGRFGAVLRAAIAGHDAQLAQAACDAVIRAREYDLASVLAAAAETAANTNAPLAAATLLTLTDALCKELAVARDRRRRDPHLIRTQVLSLLEGAVQRFGKQHERRELIEAYLLLCGRDHGVLRQTLQDPYDKACREMVTTLTRSPRPGHLRLLLGFLDDAGAPLAAVQIFAHRRDIEFLRLLFKKVGYEPTAPMKANLRRIQSLPWLRDVAALEPLDDACQHAAVQVAVASAVARDDVFEFLRQMLESGKPGGRRAAAMALAHFHGAEANDLVIEKLGDPDPQVEAALLAQLRDRGIPGALTKLIAGLDSRAAPIREAARGCLVEFTFRRYVGTFDSLEEEVRRTSGRLVKKVDPQALPGLREELGSAVRARRLRGLLMTITMEMAVEVEDELLERMEEEDHLIRAAAVRALATAGTPRARAALREALLDRSVTVQRAAEECLLETADAVPDVPDPGFADETERRARPADTISMGAGIDLNRESRS